MLYHFSRLEKLRHGEVNTFPKVLVPNKWQNQNMIQAGLQNSYHSLNCGGIQSANHFHYVRKLTSSLLLK